MPTPIAHAATNNAMIHQYFRRENFIAPTREFRLLLAAGGGRRERADRRDRPAFISESQHGPEGTQAAVETPEHDADIPNARYLNCSVLHNRRE
jgi:hypothetical protein